MTSRGPARAGMPRTGLPRYATPAPGAALQRAWFWLKRALEPAVKEACFAWFVGLDALSRRPLDRTRQRGGPLRIGLVCEELFATRLGGFGGYGRTVKSLAGHLGEPDGVSFVALMPRDLGLVKGPEVWTLDGTSTLLLPSLARLLAQGRRAQRVVRELDLDLLLTIDYQVQYEYALWLAPWLSLLVYLRDPRAEEEWRRLASVPHEAETNHRLDANGLIDIARQQRESFGRVRRWGRWTGRRLAFATNGRVLLERGRRKLGLPTLEAHPLPNPLPLPEWAPSFAERPMLLWIGRLVPQKRPWLVVELARRFPQVHFVVAGPPGPEAVTAPLLAAVEDIPNVEIAGVVDGAAKEAHFRACWGLLNTSIHEGLPVTFLEAFAFGKCVVSGVDPDGLTTRFGYCAGVTEGSGLDEATLAAFSEQIGRCLADEPGRRGKGEAARRYVEANHTFEVFGRRLRAIVEAERLLEPVAARPAPRCTPCGG